MTPSAGEPERLSALLVCALAAALTCAPQGIRAQQPTLADSAGLPPAGFGSLHQDDVAIRLATPTVQLRVLPLDERIIRLLAPDSYESLHRLSATRAPEIDRAVQQHGLPRAELFLVTFFGLEPRAEFTPDDVTVISQNRLFRPVAIVPLSPLWSELRLTQRETASAIYLYEDGIALLEPLVVSYGGVSTSQWEHTLRELERERTRVLARGAAAPRQR